MKNARIQQSVVLSISLPNTDYKIEDSVHVLQASELIRAFIEESITAANNGSWFKLLFTFASQGRGSLLWLALFLRQ